MIRSVCSAFVNAPLFRKRSAEAKLLWYTLYLHPAQHLCGLFVLDLAHMALDTGLPVERTREALAELVKFGLCQVDPAQDLVWLPEMTEQARGMVKARGTVYKGVEKYIASLGNYTLCHRVSHTLVIGSSEGGDTTLLDSGSGTDSGSGSVTGRKEDPPAKITLSSGKQTTEPIKPLQALAALVQGIDPAQDPERDGWEQAWNALQCRSRSLTTTGLPANVESGWFGVWRNHLAKVATPPTADDMRKFGRWWKAGGASETRKAWFAQLGDVGRMVEWFARSQAWDGVSAPNGKRDGPAKPAWNDPSIGTDRGLPSAETIAKWNE